jgi:FkbM family methyltransferase
MAEKRLSDRDVIHSFSRYGGPAAPGFVIDFLGTRTRTEYISAYKEARDGWVEDYPIPVNFHATALEWAGTLRAVLTARERFVAAELGAGWGPWLVSAAFAARQRGIRDVSLIGVEGSRHHLHYLRTHLADNGFDPDEHALVHGVVGAADGFAEFPVLTDPSADYGQPAQFAPPPRPPLRARLKRLVKRLLGRPVAPERPYATERVPAYSLATLLRPYAAVDLVHIDIQGHEAEVVAASRAVLAEKVRWLVIGTHGREIERALADELAPAGWAAEGAEACQDERIGGRPVLVRDGCQVWRNPRLVGERAEAA